MTGPDEGSPPRKRPVPPRRYREGTIGAIPGLYELRKKWSEAKASYPEGIAEVQLQDWREFAYYVQEGLANSPALIYRGHGDAEWNVRSSFDRLAAAHPRTRQLVTPRDHEGIKYFDCTPTDLQTHMSAFRELSGLKAGTIASHLTDEEWLAVAQHHGLPTPLVDWTLSPFVALYFAFEERWLTRVVNDVEERYEPCQRAVYAAAHHFIDDGTQAALPDVAPLIFAPRPDLTPRSEFQGSVLMRLPEGRSLEELVRQSCTPRSSALRGGPTLQRIVIPNDERIECLKFLKAMNITRASLFPDLDGAARHVVNLWDMGWETLHGQLRRMPSRIGGTGRGQQP